MTGAQIDFGPLVNPLNASDISEYRRLSRVTNVRFPNHDRAMAGSVAQIAVSAVLTAAALAFAWVMGIAFQTVELTVGRIALFIVLIVGVAGGVIYLAVWTAVRRVSFSSPWPDRVRRAQFAAANGFWFEPASTPPPAQSSVIVHDRSAETTDRFILGSDPHIEVGNFSRVAGDWVNSQRQTWGYVVLDLEVQMPHMVLRSLHVLATHPHMTVPGHFGRDQVMTLKSELAGHFTLFAPQGSEADAHRIFSPDFLALLLDGTPFEVEIVDHWMLIYSPTVLDLTSPATFERVLDLVSQPGVASLRDTLGYGPEAPVDEPRLRQRRGVAWLTVAIVAVAVAFGVARAIGSAQ